MHRTFDHLPYALFPDDFPGGIRCFPFSSRSCFSIFSFSRTAAPFVARGNKISRRHWRVWVIGVEHVRTTLSCSKGYQNSREKSIARQLGWLAWYRDYFISFSTAWHWTIPLLEIEGILDIFRVMLSYLSISK